MAIILRSYLHWSTKILERNFAETERYLSYFTHTDKYFSCQNISDAKPSDLNFFFVDKFFAFVLLGELQLAGLRIKVAND